MRTTSTEVGRWYRDDRFVVGAACAVVVLSVVGLFNLTWAVTVGLVGPVLLVVTIVTVSALMIRSTAKVSDLPFFTKLAVAGVAAKAVGTIARFYVANSVYERGDEQVYHPAAVDLGERIHQGVWSLEGTAIEAFGSQTQSVSWMLGMVYSVVGESAFLGYVVFSWMSWIGVMLLYRAFRLTIPDVDSKPYALLVFFLPSIVYWPSIMGKDAFMILCIGVVTVGFARFLAGGGIGGAAGLVALGLAGLLWVRPHMALILLAGTIPAMLVRAPTRGGRRRQLGRVVMLGILSLLMVVVVANVDAFFGDSGEGNFYERGTKQAENQSNAGGSNFEPKPVRSPLDLPASTVNVVLRPLPWQANGTTALIASAEGLVLIGLLLWKWRLLVEVPKVVFTRPAVTFAAAYVFLFIVAFSNVGNAGILARQRTQMLPFLLLVACTAWAAAKEKDAVEAERRKTATFVNGRERPAVPV